jgi:hypothetical protein
MQDEQGTCIPPEQVQAAVLGLLTDTEVQRPWSLAELEREIGDRIRTADAVTRLYAAGLVHRLGDGFVFATRAAVRADELR